jgi:Uma2 family endonuclease
MNAPIDLNAPPHPRTVEDLVRDLGGIPLQRIRLRPPIGTATTKDLERNKGCELVDGTLVEKAMGWQESVLAAFLITVLNSVARTRNLGLVSGEDGGFELITDLIRKPDVAFISWERLPNGHVPEESWPPVAPDLAVEVISKGNTAEEMDRKRGEYFDAGVRLVWEVDRFKRTVTVYTSPSESRILNETDTLDGGTVLPGLTIPVHDIFAELDRHG